MFDFARPCDVLVVGGGNAALAAAITARRAGVEVALVEHAPRPFRGGNSRHTRNLRVMHAAPIEGLTGAYLEEEYWEDLLRVTGGETDEALARMTIRASEAALGFLGAHGVRFQPALSGALSLDRTNAFFLGGGKALVNALFASAERLGVRVAYEAEVTGLAFDQGCVREVSVLAGETRHTLRPKAVVVAAGGFQANLEWLRAAWEGADNFLIRGTPYARGTVLKSLLDQGAAAVGDPTQGHMVAIDARAPKFDGGIVTRLDCVPFSIVVNREGRRFYDEGEDLWPKRYAIWGRLVAEQPGQIAWSIFDAKAETLFMPSVYPAVRAETIADLAGQLGLDAAALEGTVAAYNAAVRPGGFQPASLDDGCATEGLVPPKSHWARTIDTPPFSAYPLRPGVTFTYMGLRVDRTARVICEGGLPAENLWAAGEIMAGAILGRGYLAGFGMTIGAVFGRLAGEGAARHARG